MTNLKLKVIEKLKTFSVGRTGVISDSYFDPSKFVKSISLSKEQKRVRRTYVKLFHAL